MPVVGTAGHVDHGKSTLVAALTGINPDRWEEERRRGLTIDLGFAWANLPDGRRVSFVDVPGHERFIKNMLAGIEAIDAALLLVAANEGWMPQSEEHLAVLDLLEVTRGVVALTKTDLVDTELASLVEMEIAEKLSGTTAADWPVIRVSVPRGLGLGEVAANLSAALAGYSSVDLGRPRMWIDRTFSIRGAGTVVTGTLLDGGLSVGDRVEVWPERATARIRGIESHGESLSRVGPGWRVAANLTGLGRRTPERGNMLTVPGQWRATDSALAMVHPARYVTGGLPRRGAYHLHIGSGAWPVRFTPLEKSPGAVLAHLQPAEPLGLAMGDRFILRETGRRMVVGGGRILDPGPPPTMGRRREAAARLADLVGSPSYRQADGLLEVRGQAPLDQLAAHTRGGVPRQGMTAAGLAISDRLAESLREELEAIVERHHRENPFQLGMPAASAASELGIGQALLANLADTHPRLLAEGTVVRDPEAEGDLDPAEAPAWVTARRRLSEGGLLTPDPASLGLDEDLAHALQRAGLMVRISPSICYLPEQVDDLLQTAGDLSQPFTVSAFREAAGLSRKYAVPFLEWSDRQGITRRRGDRRHLVQRPQD